MAISLTTDGLNLDYRDTSQSEVSGTYPIGTVITLGSTLTLPGTWLWRHIANPFGKAEVGSGSTPSGNAWAIRVE